jgi:ribonuclease HI
MGAHCVNAVLVFQVIFEKVPAHSGNKGNVEADHLANVGARAIRHY